MESRLAPSFLPSTAVLEMTYRCNHECAFCSCPWYAPKSSFERLPEMSVEAWRRTIGRLCGMGVTSLAFTGGEPLLKEGLPDLVRFAAGLTVEHIETKDGGLVSRHAPPDLYLLSNGRAVDLPLLEFCRELNVRLSLSLPGLRTFGWHTGGGDPDKVLRWFGEAKRLGVRTTAGITVTRKNLPEFYETISGALLAGADQVLLNRFLPGGRGLLHADELSLDAAQLVEFLDIAEDVLTTAGRWGSLGTEVPKCVVDAAKYQRLTVGTRCSAALQFFVVDPSGYVRACNHSPVRLDHVDEVEKVKDNPYWRRFTMKEYLPEACWPCGQKGVCDGGCREAAHIWGGAVDSVDPIFASGLPFGVAGPHASG